jgi:hypothetical protein
MNIANGTMVLGGDRGFTFRAGVRAGAGVFNPAHCNPCVPGATLSLFAFWNNGDLPGVATLEGGTYTRFGSFSDNSMSVTFSGSATLPPLAASATLTVPFSFSGSFWHTAGSTALETLSGGGTVTVSLAADPFVPGRWSVRRVFYSLNSTLPDGWVTADVGQVGRAGDAFFSNGTFVVNGAGADIWGTADAFRFVFQRFDGDAEIVARVDAESFTHSFAKAGLMFRESADASDAHVILDVRPDGNVEFMTRSAANGTTTFLAGGPPYTLPLLLRLGRSGAEVAAAPSSRSLRQQQTSSASFCGARRVKRRRTLPGSPHGGLVHDAVIEQPIDQPDRRGVPFLCGATVGGARRDQPPGLLDDVRICDGRKVQSTR